MLVLRDLRPVVPFQNYALPSPLALLKAVVELLQTLLQIRLRAARNLRKKGNQVMFWCCSGDKIEWSWDE